MFRGPKTAFHAAMLCPASLGELCESQENQRRKGCHLETVSRGLKTVFHAVMHCPALPPEGRKEPCIASHPITSLNLAVAPTACVCLIFNRVNTTCPPPVPTHAIRMRVTIYTIFQRSMHLKPCKTRSLQRNASDSTTNSNNAERITSLPVLHTFQVFCHPIR